MNTLVFDIETIPDAECGGRVFDLQGLPDADIVRALEQLQFQKTGRTFMPHFLHRIVAISVLLESPRDIRLWSLDGSEAEMIERFFSGMEQYTPQLVSWNGTRFDLPVLHYRSLLHGVPAPRYWETGDEDRGFRYNNYFNRYHWRHLDLMDVLSAYNLQAAAALDHVAKFIGLPGKQGMDGSEVWSAFQAGELVRIRDYCETDVLNTYLVYLRFELMRGRCTRKGYAEQCDRVREMLAQSGSPHLEAFAEEWSAPPSSSSSGEEAE